jgi:class 3 adenylate cyclase
MLQLGAFPTPARLQDVLRQRLGDPSLLVARWSSSQGAFLADDGRMIEQPASDDPRTLTVLEQDGRPVGAVLHDAALLDEPAVRQTILSAAAVALEATEVRDELRARGGHTEGLPTGEVTFLFADVEGSTRLLETLGTRYGPLIEELRRLASDIADRHDGRLVDASGDELFLAFPRASAALETAIELARRLDRAVWPDDEVVRVRMGVHTGRPDLTRAGYVGIDVHRAARIMAAANGGQIIASAIVSRRIAAPHAVSLRPLGRYTLRGIRDPIDLVEVEGDGLRSGLPPRAEQIGQDS